MLGLKHQEIKDNLCELSLQERNEAYDREVGMTSAHARAVSGKVWSTTLSILTPSMNCNYQAPKLIEMSYPNHTAREILEMEVKLFQYRSYITQQRRRLSVESVFSFTCPLFLPAF